MLMSVIFLNLRTADVHGYHESVWRADVHDHPQSVSHQWQCGFPHLVTFSNVGCKACAVSPCLQTLLLL